MNYLFLLLGLGIAGGSLFYGLIRPPALNFRARNQCHNHSRYDMDVTYQDTCPANRTTYRTYYGCLLY
ncbi:hypothetical protein IQ266_26385, partial [filamentous cyanobacterium LEGE 11480]